MKPIKIFLCYDDEDAALVRRLKNWLDPLISSGRIEIWSYQRVISLINIDWQQEFKYQFNTANIILLLTSLNFLASDRCYQIEARVEPHYPVVEHKAPLRRRTLGLSDGGLGLLGSSNDLVRGRPLRLGMRKADGAIL